MKQAKSKGAHLVHFSEACLTGYLGNELKSVREMDWDAVSAAMEEIMGLAGHLGLWVVVGSNHPLSDPHKPHNSLYVVSDRGRLVNRYDKMFCTGDHDDDGDLHHYSPGEAFVTFQVREVMCGLLICHDFRYPELFRHYKRLGVQLMLVSFHNAGASLQNYHNYTTWVSTTIQAAAASNYFAVSANNGTRRHAWPSFLVSAQGLVVSRARPHRPAVLINPIDTEVELYDASGAWRDRCMQGTFHSGTLTRDPRSSNRIRI
jgi:predicted amidohydrolase